MNNISCATFLLPLLWLLWLLDSFWWIRFARSLCSFVLLVVFLDENSSFWIAGVLFFGVVMDAWFYEEDDDDVMMDDGWWRLFDIMWGVLYSRLSFHPLIYLSIQIWLFSSWAGSALGQLPQNWYTGAFWWVTHIWMCSCVMCGSFFSWYCQGCIACFSHWFIKWRSLFLANSSAIFPAHVFIPRFLYVFHILDHFWAGFWF